MRLGELGEQIVLISKKSFDNVKYIGNEIDIPSGMLCNIKAMVAIIPNLYKLSFLYNF